MMKLFFSAVYPSLEGLGRQLEKHAQELLEQTGGASDKERAFALEMAALSQAIKKFEIAPPTFHEELRKKGYSAACSYIYRNNGPKGTLSVCCAVQLFVDLGVPMKLIGSDAHAEFVEEWFAKSVKAKDTPDWYQSSAIMQFFARGTIAGKVPCVEIQYKLVKIPNDGGYLWEKYRQGDDVPARAIPREEKNIRSEDLFPDIAGCQEGLRGNSRTYFQIGKYMLEIGQQSRVCGLEQTMLTTNEIFILAGHLGYWYDLMSSTEVLPPNWHWQAMKNAPHGAVTQYFWRFLGDKVVVCALVEMDFAYDNGKPKQTKEAVTKVLQSLEEKNLPFFERSSHGDTDGIIVRYALDGRGNWRPLKVGKYEFDSLEKSQ